MHHLCWGPLRVNVQTELRRMDEHNLLSVTDVFSDIDDR